MPARSNSRLKSFSPNNSGFAETEQNKISRFSNQNSPIQFIFINFVRTSQSSWLDTAAMKAVRHRIFSASMALTLVSYISMQTRCKKSKKNNKTEIIGPTKNEISNKSFWGKQ